MVLITPGFFRIEHDNKGRSQRWLLSLVLIVDLHSKRQHLFYCNQWLMEADGNACWREITSAPVPKGFSLATMQTGTGLQSIEGVDSIDMNIVDRQSPISRSKNSSPVTSEIEVMKFHKGNKRRRYRQLIFLYGKEQHVYPFSQNL